MPLRSLVKFRKSGNYSGLYMVGENECEFQTFNGLGVSMQCVWTNVIDFQYYRLCGFLNVLMSLWIA